MPNREFTPSSGNVFADLNLPHADDLLAKAELAAKIIAEIQRRRLTQSQAAAILGIDQPKVSALKQGKLSGFSIERLMRLLLSAWPRYRDHRQSKDQAGLKCQTPRRVMILVF